MPHRIYERMMAGPGVVAAEVPARTKMPRADDRADAQADEVEWPSSRFRRCSPVASDSAISCATGLVWKDSWGIGALFSRPVPWQQGFFLSGRGGRRFPHRRQSSMRRSTTTSRQRLRLTRPRLAGRLSSSSSSSASSPSLPFFSVVLVLIIVVALALAPAWRRPSSLSSSSSHLREESFLSFSSSSSSTSGKSSSSSSAAPFSPSSSSLAVAGGHEVEDGGDLAEEVDGLALDESLFWDSRKLVLDLVDGQLFLEVEQAR